MRRLIGIAMAAAALVPAISPARAQTLEPPRERQGYYLAVGPHFALNQNWENDRDWRPWAGYDVSFRVGQLVTRRFGLGLQLHYGGSRGPGQRATLYGLTVEGQWELARHLAVRGGVGLDAVSIASVGATDDSARGVAGAGYLLGVSYDWFFTRRHTGGWAVTPVAQVRLVPGKTDALVGTVGVELSYWTGLPRNQLELPASEAFKLK